ncbi:MULTISPECIES: M20 aminoacylase family protein [Bosea]|uniref:M20 aminoacylase family protein n=1 Tax=Bosea TaxID=85413 RepID=UPI002150187E|nr:MULTISPECIES: M20 aminoacylase family protein [Bosea]MCR4521672.1 M20 family metallopeptidase [Bosea sp. 47.2.35]MDR6828229.1 hippurate hydrolase [Bosea robiniae]MDR6897799.1 hippurate hydrolase [Bosea sp. BE109]MDR7141228.1 hippurate hydrolase [Bosea sp. BE168]MDR7177890.1 hippurate hydrolase [Bosea sp. BE271]
MPALPQILSFTDELVAIRRDLHAHPEIGFEEVRTSNIVAEKLAAWGIEVHRGIGKTGVIGILHGTGGPGRRIGLRADMDALPIQEITNLPWRSTVAGKMHACGHDGHTTMLLGAARYLAENRGFKGTAVFVFQPAEEGLGGARSMIAEKLFERFPCDEIYGLHNSPDLDPGQISIFPGPAMAGADFFDIKITGRGSHGAMPHMGRDPIVVAMSLANALQTIVSRNADPREAAVLSITQIHAGSAYNVIPEEAVLAGTIRTFSPAIGALVRERMREIAAGTAASFGVTIDVDIRNIFDVLVNHETQTQAVVEVAAEIVGTEGVLTEVKPLMGSEDFADMLRAVPGAYAWVGHAGTVPVHNPAYVLDDGILPVGASLLARLVETRAAA